MQCVPGAQDRMVLRLWCVKKVSVHSPVDLCFPVCELKSKKLFDTVFYLCYGIRESKKKGQDGTDEKRGCSAGGQLWNQL